MVSFKDIQRSAEIKTYIRQADASLATIGYTEHSFPHAMNCAKLAHKILLELNYSEHDAELAQIAGYMHDIGNVVNRTDHAQTGAIIAFRLLEKMGMSADDIASVITAIGNHDEATAYPVNAIAAALILADKTDVRRSRVRDIKTIDFDIHDRVNYAVEKSAVEIDSQKRTITLLLDIDTEICAVMEYFEIFIGRMLLCQKAARFLGLQFRLKINGSNLL